MKWHNFKSWHLCILIFFFIGYLLGDQGESIVSAVTDKNYENLKIFSEVLHLIQKNYVEEPKVDQLIEGALNGMLATLDPHSAYLSPEEYKEMQVETKGKFGGIGIEITLKDGILTVVAPIEDTPAYQAGIKSGDQIIKINDEFTKNMTIFDAVKRLRGKEGTKVTITIMREGLIQPKEFTLTRATIQVKSVKSKVLEDKIGYIRITQFQEQTAQDFHKALTEIETNNPNIKGMILDLRNNPGGLLESAVEICDEFIDSGLIVYTEGRTPESRMEFKAKADKHQHDYPMVILVNAGSASGSEIVAGSLQDHGLALLLGTTTFGKGSVQTVMPLENGGGLRITTAKYFTPKGRSIHGKGIEPDIVVEDKILAEKSSSEKIRVMRENDLENFYSNFKSKSKEKDEEKIPEKEEEVKGDDPQLNRAIEILKSWEIFKGKSKINIGYSN
ncbi:MAG: S41 family peptidase [Desulfobacterota bacterium]|nr:S41 family peptidase [Thermodesulfobacteriota bacterium]